MLRGIQLTLLIGPAVPLPAPQEVIDALTSVQITSGGQRSAFQLTFSVSKRSLLQTTLLPAGYFDPIVTRVVVIVTLNGVPHVLMDGLVTRQESAPSNEPGQSTLTVTGEDLSVAMNVVQVKRQFPAMPEVAQIYLVLAPYAAFGIVPLVVPPFVTTVKTPLDQADTQTVTDLEYLQQLAARCGYVFYVEPGPAPLSSIAYFGPDIRIPVPQPALTVNSDAHTNVESISFSLDGLAKKILVPTVLDPVTRKVPIPIPLPNINVFRPPLGLRPTPPARVEFPDDLANLPPDEAAKRIIGKLSQSAEAISASGSLDVLRYGHILRARQIVGVRGAGLAYDGMYYVNSVTHTIKRGEYKQSFSLVRDGLISQTPVVPT
ncbi:MAG: hypothetical protein DIU80_019550 [Chloroflexota bacterium]|nr:MAG: hypothetical protein DIU80_21885 [Chloroflexota bacterium]